MPSSSIRRAASVALCAVSAAALIATPAAAAFGEASAQVWAERSQRIAAAVAKPVATSADLDESEQIAFAYFSGVKDACTGITGEHIRYGGKNMPVWAQTAQGSFCLGADNLVRAYRSGEKNKKYCGDFRTSVGAARKAKRGVDPDGVVDGAEALITAAETLMATKVTFEKKSILGNSRISFAC